MATHHMHPYLTPAVQQLVIDAGLVMEAAFWTHNSSHWALVNTQFQNTVIALHQHGCPLTPTLVAYPPNYVVDFERLAIHPHSNLTPQQAAHKLGWTKPATSTTCWWGKRQGGPCRGAAKPGQPGFVDGPGNVTWGARYHGGVHPRTALNAHIKRKVLTNRANPNAIYIPWWGAGLPYAKILEMRAQGRAQ
jgi:hypothetical protein